MVATAALGLGLGAPRPASAGTIGGFGVRPARYDPHNPATRAYGNLYGNLLDYVISAALIFYIMTIAGIFRLRRTRPDAGTRAAFSLPQALKNRPSRAIA